MARKHLLEPELLAQARDVVARLRAVGGSVKLRNNSLGQPTRATLVPPDIYHAMPAADKAFFRAHKQEFIAAVLEVPNIPTGGDDIPSPTPQAPVPPPTTLAPPRLPPPGPDGVCALSVAPYREWCDWRDAQRQRLRTEPEATVPTVAVKFRDRLDGPIEFIPTRQFNPETHVEWDFNTRRPR
jgi:hypothetical protein